MDKINCECGTSVTKQCLNRHLKSQKHTSFLKNKTPQPTEEETKQYDEEKFKPKPKDIEPDSQDETDTEEQSENEAIEEADNGADEEEVEEVKEVKPIINKNYKNKYHLDAIREKAIAKIKQKKQAKIDKENEIKRKAEQYDALVKSMKQKEEDEKKKREEEKIKEMEYKSSQYDKMVKQQQRNSALTSLSNEKIMSDIKEQRMNYLMKYLQNPTYY